MSTFFPKDKDTRPEYSLADEGDGRRANVYWSRPYVSRVSNRRRTHGREVRLARPQPVSYGFEPVPRTLTSARTGERRISRAEDSPLSASENSSRSTERFYDIRTESKILEPIRLKIKDSQERVGSVNLQNEVASSYEAGGEEFDDQSETETKSVTSFDLDLIYHDKKLGGGKDEGNSFANWPNADGNMMSIPAIPAKCNSKVLTQSIIRSRYLKSDLESRRVVAELTLGIDGAQKEQPDVKPLFRWVHLTNAILDFEDLILAIHEAPNLSSIDKDTVVKQIELFRKSNEKPLRTPRGIKGRYMEGDGLEAVYSNQTSEGSESSAVLVLSIPYFALQKYIPNNLSESSPGHFSRTLLQSIYSSTQEERDMQQAVCQLDGTPKGHCFAVPQLWCCIFNESHLFTFSRLREDEVGGEMLRAIKTPSISFAHLQVTNGYNIWQLPIKDCESWAAFLANMFSSRWDRTELFTRRLRVFLDQKRIRPYIWHRVIAKARVHPLCVRVAFETFDESSDESSSSDEMFQVVQDGKYPASFEVTLGAKLPGQKISPNIDKGQTRARPRPKQSKKRALQKQNPQFNRFHVYTWVIAKDGEEELEEIPDKYNQNRNRSQTLYTTSSEFLEKKLKSFLDRLDDTFTKSLNRDERSAYKSCSLKTLRDVVQMMDSTDGSDSDEYRRRGGDKNHFIKQSKCIFEFFLPLSCDHPIALKFWGAVCERAKVPREIHGDARHFATAESHDFDIVASVVEDIQKGMSHGRGPLPWKIDMPEHFQKAYLHCLTYLLPIDGKATRRSKAQISGKLTHIKRCMDLIVEGRSRLHGDLRGEALSKKESVLPHSITAIICENLIGDVTGKFPDIPSTYESFFKSLIVQVQAEPLKRQHQGKISFLRQEIHAIIRTLEQQGKVMAHLQQYMDSKRVKAESFMPDSISNRDYRPIEDALATINNRIDGFREISDQASELERWSLRQIETNKDRQEAAIYAFTVVTVIFLPLSFVTSFLGMNTVDIRDMGSSQWIFWAIGVPLTAVIMLIALIWAGELLNSFRGIINVIMRKTPSSKMGAAWVPDDEVLLMPVGTDSYAVPQTLEDRRARNYRPMSPSERVMTARPGTVYI